MPIEVLRPAQACPREPIPRDWYSYMVLHDAYREGIPNNDNMSKLYISEGTFHRTRRAAVRSVARVFLETRMERQKSPLCPGAEMVWKLTVFGSFCHCFGSFKMEN